MKHWFTLVLLLCGTLLSDEIKPWPEFTWMMRWNYREWELGQYLDVEKYIIENTPFTMPVLKKYPRSVKQLDGIIANSMKWQKSLEWALDFLKPTSGPAATLPDSLRREIIYYLYNNRLILLKKPWKFTYDSPLSDRIHGGTGTNEVGWIRYADIFGEEPILQDLTCVYWAPSDDSVMTSPRALMLFKDAKEEGVFASRSINPEWGEPLTVAPCTLFNRPAVFIRVPLEFDEVFWDTRYPDTLNVFAFATRSYQYLVGFTSAIGDPGPAGKGFSYWRRNLEFRFRFEP